MVALIIIIVVVWMVASAISFLYALSHERRINDLEEQLRRMRLREIEDTRKKEEGILKSEPKEELPPVKIDAPEPEKPPFRIPIPPIEENIFERPLPPPAKEAEKMKEEEWTPREVPPPQSRTSAEWEALIGGKVLNRIGALALIIGVGFFLKYAFDNNWITEAMRVVIGFVAGAALLYTGDRYHRKDFRNFSQGVIGAGIAVLYLSVYAAFNYYHLVSFYPAIGLMSLVTVITLFLAFRYDSIAIVLLGLTGGFLTPFMLNTVDSNETGLFAYLVILDAGLLWITWKKEKWWIIEPLSLFATIIIYISFTSRYYSITHWGVAAFFLLIFWMLFHAIELMRIVSPAKKILPLHQIISLVNASFFFIALYNVVNRVHHEWMGLITLMIAGVYAGVYVLVLNKRSEDRWLHLRYLLSAVILSVLAAAIQFKGFQLSIAWTIESAALLVLAWRYKNQIMFYASTGIFVMSMINYLVADSPFRTNPDEFHFIFNERFLALSVMIIGAVAFALLSRKIQSAYSNYIRIASTYAAIGILFTLITIETSDYFRHLAYYAEGNTRSFFEKTLPWVLGMEWLLVALPLMFYSFRNNNKELHISSLTLTGLSFLFICIASVLPYYPDSYPVPFVNIRSLALVFMGVALFIESRWVQKAASYFFSYRPADVLQILVVASAFTLVSVETRDSLNQLANHSEGDRKLFISAIIPFVIGTEWLLLALPLLLYSLGKMNLALQVTSLVLTGLSVLIICGAGMRTYSPLSYFVPLLNLRALALTALTAGLFIEAFRMEKTQAALLPANLVDVIRVAGVAVIFLLLTVETSDIFQKKLENVAALNPPDRAQQEEMYRNLQQLFISGVWLLYSVVLMGIGIYRRSLNIRIVSIVIFGITIAKVFFYDLSYLNTLHRIFSFIGLGLILLLVSYLYSRFKDIIFKRG